MLPILKDPWILKFPALGLNRCIGVERLYSNLLTFGGK